MKKLFGSVCLIVFLFVASPVVAYDLLCEGEGGWFIMRPEREIIEKRNENGKWVQVSYIQRGYLVNPGSFASLGKLEEGSLILELEVVDLDFMITWGTILLDQEYPCSVTFTKKQRYYDISFYRNMGSLKYLKNDLVYEMSIHGNNARQEGWRD